MSKKSKRTEHKKPWLGKRKLLYSISFLLSYPTLINKWAKQSYTQTFRFHSLKQTTFYPLLSNSVHQDEQIHFTSSTFTPFMYSLHYSSLYFSLSNIKLLYSSVQFFTIIFLTVLFKPLLQIILVHSQVHITVCTQKILYTGSCL